MARTCLGAILISSAIQATSANFLFNSVKSMCCSAVKVPIICSGSSAGSTLGGGGSSSCSGGGCCSGSSCYSVPMMGCSSSRGPANCVGGGVTTAGQCMCTSGSCNQGVCAGGSGSSSSSSSMMSDLSDLFEDGDHDKPMLVGPEDHSRALALYTGAACLLVVAGLSAGVRQARAWTSSSSRGMGAEEQEDQRPAWELLEQASTSDEIMD